MHFRARRQRLRLNARRNPHVGCFGGLCCLVLAWLVGTVFIANRMQGGAHAARPATSRGGRIRTADDVLTTRRYSDGAPSWTEQRRRRDIGDAAEPLRRGRQQKQPRFRTKRPSPRPTAQVPDRRPSAAPTPRTRAPSPEPTRLAWACPDHYLPLPSTGNGARGVVMSVALGYKLRIFRRFLGSLRRTGFDGAVLVGVDGARVDADVRDYACGLGVELVPIDGMASREHYFKHFSYRHTLYQAWARRFDAQTWVMTADFRDSVFQAHPLSSVLATSPSHTAHLLAFEETRVSPEPRRGVEGPALRLGTCPFNAPWIKYCFGQHVLKAIEDRPISCAGTVVATAGALDAYAARMLRLMSRYAKSPYCKPGGDQPFHNLLLYHASHASTAPYDVEVQQQGAAGSIVNTVGYVAPLDRLRRDDAGWVLNADGEKSPVVHQFDRHEALATFYDATFQVDDDGAVGAATDSADEGEDGDAATDSADEGEGGAGGGGGRGPQPHQRRHQRAAASAAAAAAKARRKGRR